MLARDPFAVVARAPDVLAWASESGVRGKPGGVGARVVEGRAGTRGAEGWREGGGFGAVGGEVVVAVARGGAGGAAGVVGGLATIVAAAGTAGGSVVVAVTLAAGLAGTVGGLAAAATVDRGLVAAVSLTA